MIKKTLLLFLSVLSVGLISVSACSSSNATAKETTNYIPLLTELREMEQQKSVFDSNLMAENRFTMKIVPTVEEKKIAKQHARTFEVYLGNGKFFMYHLLNQLKEQDLPVELAAIPMIESGLQPRVHSYAGAVGPWQYMRRTGKSLGLTTTQTYDELYDFVETTRVSLQYFKYLYKEFDNNWDLAVAAYNQGEFGVKAAYRAAKSRGVTNFNINTVGINSYAKGYVKRFHAYAEMLHHPERYGIKMPEIKNRPAFKRVQVAGRLNSMKKAAELSGASLETLRLINAGYLTDRLETKDEHGLLVPSEHAGRLEQALRNGGNSLSTQNGGARTATTQAN